MARVRPWTRSTRRAFLVVSGAHAGDSRVPSGEVLAEWTDVLARWGYDSVRTNALGPDLAATFVNAGFTAVQNLVLLDLRITDAVPPGNNTTIAVTSSDGRVCRLGARLHRGAARHLIEVDQASFPGEWALDRYSLLDALGATPSTRVFHVWCRARGERMPRTTSLANDEMVGFLIMGLAGDTAYVQRLAVRPQHQRNGIARSLMVEGLRWSQRRGCGRSVVNTETDNSAALALYHGLGFRAMGHGLTVMERALHS